MLSVFRGRGKKGKAAFRQAFGKVKDLRSFVGNTAMLALTATADKSMRKRLCKLLGFRDHREIVISPNRDNIRFTVLECDKTLNCFDWLVDILKKERVNAPQTIVFCHTVNDIVLVLSTLLMKLGDHAYLEGSAPGPDRCILAVYYSATPDSAKVRVTNSYTGSGNARVVIATTSLSMGVDFPHVRYVIHFGPGRTLADHLQQAGRAGRDSQNAYNIIMYMGKHIRQCEVAIRNVIKKQECIRELLLCHFTDDEPTVAPMHNCCNHCHNLCKCDGDKCACSLFPFDKLSSEAVGSEKVRTVTDSDKQCLRDALREIRQSLSSRTNVRFFDSSGVLCHGLSDSVIESIVDNSHKIFGVSDLMEHSFVSSLQLAVMIIEIFIELFEDITHDSNLHSLAAETEPMYNELIDNIQVPDIELHPDQMSDSDN